MSYKSAYDTMLAVLEIVFNLNMSKKMNAGLTKKLLVLCSSILCFSSVNAMNVGSKEQTLLNQNMKVDVSEFCAKVYENSKAEHPWIWQAEFANTLSVEQGFLKKISSSYLERQKYENSFIEEVVSAYNSKNEGQYMALINGYMLWKGACLKTFSVGHRIFSKEEVFNKVCDRLIMKNLKMKSMLLENKDSILNDYICYSTHTGFIENETRNLESSKNASKLSPTDNKSVAPEVLSCVDMLISEMQSTITKLLKSDVKSTRDVMSFLGENQSQKVSVAISIIRRGDISELVDVLYVYGKYVLDKKHTIEPTKIQYDENLLFKESFESLVANFAASCCNVNMSRYVAPKIFENSVFNCKFANKLLNGNFSVSLKHLNADVGLCSQNGAFNKVRDPDVLKEMSEWFDSLVVVGQQKNRGQARYEILTKIWTIDDEILNSVSQNFNKYNPQLILKCLLKKYCLYELLNSVKD